MTGAAISDQQSAVDRETEKASGTHKSDLAIYLRLREALTREQVEQVVEMILHTHGLAIERKCDQSLTLAFNEKGYLRRIDGSNNIRPVSPLSGVAPATQVAGVGDSGLKPPRPKVPPE